MSWDLFVQDWGNVSSISEIPDDFEPKTIGKRIDIISKILEVEPLVDYSDQSWGRFETEQFSIEFNMGEEEELFSFTLHVRGNELSIPFIGQILENLELKAADGASEDFFNIEDSKKNLSS